METQTLKTLLLFALLLVTAVEVYSDDNDGAKPGEEKDPAKTNTRENDLIMKDGVVANEKNFKKNEKELEKEEKKEWKGEEKGANLPPIEKYENKDDNSGQSEGDDKGKDPSVTKRFLRDHKNSRWDKAIVPYVFKSTLTAGQVGAIKRAMALYEYWTCFRFVPWTNTTQTEYGLPHNNYLFYVSGGGCWSYVGNLRRKNGGQPISCCGGSACVHEIGHAIGYTHEQKHPDQGDFLRLNFKNINPRYWSQFYKTTSRAYFRDDFPYNTNSYMHYQFWMFRVGRGDTMTLFDPRFRYLIDKHDPTQFYMFKAAVVIYQCKELKCSNFTMKCENDGYLSYIDNKCSCRCIKGLDPKTGCTTLLREGKLEKSLPWPNSNFAILRQKKAKCPTDSKEGSVTHSSDGGWTSDNYQAMGDHDTQHFCTFNHHSRNATSIEWPAGEYCISRVGGKCPENECPKGWKFNIKNKHCYKQSENYIRGYTKAMAFCRQQGAYIVSIKDKEENVFVNSIRSGTILIGANDVNKEGIWVWEDGEVATYNNWRSGQPDNWYNEDCATMTWYGLWNDRHCHHNFKVMCEMTYPEFQKGSIEFEDDTVTKTGSVPDTFTESKAKFEFCCRQGGNRANAIALPTADKFILWQSNKKGCQVVKDTIAVSNHFAHRMKAGKNVTICGTTPLSYIKDNVGYLYFCAYQPISRDCGGIIELSDNTPEKTFTSPYYPHSYHANMECTWLIKSPPNTKIVLSFEEFEIPSATAKCEDSLEIRFSQPEHPGIKYCGSGFKTSIYSFINYINLILDSKDFRKGKKFKANAKLVKDEDLCYYAKDKGLTYRGKVSFSRGYMSCLPWKNATHCVHSPDNVNDKDQDLVENYCRNPKSGTEPWCYTKAKDCVRDYCDVCGNGKCLDLADNCEDLIKTDAEYCSDTTKWKGGIVRCAKTCGLCSHQTKKKYTEITCLAPATPKNAKAVNASPVPVGKAYMFKYNTNDNNIFSQTCFSDGTLSKLRECPDGWTVVGKKCVKAFKQKLRGLYAANNICKKYGGYVVTINNKNENKAIARLVKEAGSSMAIGLTDGIKEGDFVWYNGKNATYTNFEKGGLYVHPTAKVICGREKLGKKEEPAPNDWYNQDCTLMYTNGIWNDIACHTHFRGVVCQIDMPVNTCDDGTLKCEKFYKVEDVAKGKEATQSSKYPWGSWGASNALNNKWNICTHTKYDTNPWWKVDLKQAYKIETIVLVNRQDCCGSRLRNLVITVGESEQDMKECVKYEGYAKTTEVLELRCTSPLKGQYVKVQIQGRTYLTLCEVMINVFTE